MANLRRSVLALLLVSATAYNCTGLPRTFGDVLAAYDSVAYMNATRPNMAARWSGLDQVGDGDLPARAPPDDVFVSMQVNKLKNVETKTQTYALDVSVRVVWYDTRLAYDATCLQLDSIGNAGLPERFFNKIWKPDLYSRTASTRPHVEQSSIWVAPNGRVWWNRKMNWQLGCHMNFENVPFDVHTCTMELEGFTNDNSEIRLRFPSHLQIQVSADPPAVPRSNATLNGPFEMTCIRGGSIEFKLTNISGTSGFVSGSSDMGQSVADATTLNYQFVFQRNPGFYVKFRLVPLILLVVMAYLSFFVARAAVPARVSLVVVVFLSCSGMINSALGELPKSGGYVWLLDLEYAALLFISAAVLECKRLASPSPFLAWSCLAWPPLRSSSASARPCARLEHTSAWLHTSEYEPHTADAPSWATACARRFCQLPHADRSSCRQGSGLRDEASLRRGPKPGGRGSRGRDLHGERHGRGQADRGAAGPGDAQDARSRRARAPSARRGRQIEAARAEDVHQGRACGRLLPIHLPAGLRHHGSRLRGQIATNAWHGAGHRPSLCGCVIVCVCSYFSAREVYHSGARTLQTDNSYIPVARSHLRQKRGHGGPRLVALLLVALAARRRSPSHGTFSLRPCAAWRRSEPRRNSQQAQQGANLCDCRCQ